ncbi:MAG TPA: hypothetical protein VFS83_05325 [Ktedonobacterales bacterium]|nr:hypothetical protein [Ktedonobacterales bacterium]
MSGAAIQHQEQDGRGDFDFIVGRWNVHHRRLRERLKGCADWDEFDGTTEDRSIVGGLGNIGEASLALNSTPLVATSLRLFDPQTRQWSVYFTNSMQGTLSPPMTGGFTQGRGEFYAQEPFEGKQVFTRLIWSDITPTSIRWEQAFSADGGRTWETNWIMELTRQQE